MACFEAMQGVLQFAAAELPAAMRTPLVVYSFLCMQPLNH
jgi:hypothetical protein